MTTTNSTAPEGRAITEDDLAQEAGEFIPPTDFYDSQSKQFLVKNQRGAWLPHDCRSYTRILKKRGHSASPRDGSPLSEVDLIILEVQNLRDIRYHGPICGRNAGLVEENGVRILVTEDMPLQPVAAGSWGMLQKLLLGLFFHSESLEIGGAQFNSFLGWMKSSVEALRDNREQQQQALVICGPAGCGKSLLQHLITQMLGGRSAKAHRYFAGQTSFNADLFAAEHLIIEDNCASKRIADRQNFGALLKEHCVGVSTASLHPKGRDAINIRPWWRISITLNDDPEAMMILPPLDDHIADKIMLLRASRFEFPMPTRTADERAAFMRRLRSEIPAFLHHLHILVPSVASEDSRYNVKTFHHPDLAASLNELSPEADLLSFVDMAFADRFVREPFLKLTASELEKLLRAADPHRADKLFSFRNACGTYLGRAARKFPSRVVEARTSSCRFWQFNRRNFNF